MRREICPSLPVSLPSVAFLSLERTRALLRSTFIIVHSEHLSRGSSVRDLVPPAGLEPATFSFVRGTLYPLSYGGTIAILTDS